MPIFEHQCTKCGYRSEEFVWITSKDGVRCPHCHNQMVRLFTTSNMPLLNRQKPRSFTHNVQECSADKDIWQSVIVDAQKGRATDAEIKWWKKEIEKDNPDLIL